MYCIMSWEAYKKGRYYQSTYNRNCEFITLIVYVLALGITILSVLLYKGMSRDL